MIEAQEIKFNPPIESPNVINASMPDHGKSANAIDDHSYVFAVSELTTPLMDVKNNLFQASLSQGCFDNYRYCASDPDGCL